jgi:hypothetical protein
LQLGGSAHWTVRRLFLAVKPKIVPGARPGISENRFVPRPLVQHPHTLLADREPNARPKLGRSLEDAARFVIRSAPGIAVGREAPSISGASCDAFLPFLLRGIICAENGAQKNPKHSTQRAWGFLQSG